MEKMFECLMLNVKWTESHLTFSITEFKIT